MELGRWLIVRTVARGLRDGICLEEMDRIMRARFPYRDWTWRAGIYEDAQGLNARRAKARA